MQHAALEQTLSPANEDLTHIMLQRPKEEDGILRAMTLMAAIRTRALDRGWDSESESDLREVQSILQSIKNSI